MRSSLPLLIMTVWAIAPAAWSQTAARPTAAQSAAAAPRKARVGHGSRSSPSRHPRSSSATASRQARAAAGKPDGVLALGATDITGNKELPKVMVIVPWKDSLGAGGVVKPTDSLLDEVLGPVDRGVFQRQIRYYGQLNAATGRPAASAVAPSGDTR